MPEGLKARSPCLPLDRTHQPDEVRLSLQLPAHLSCGRVFVWSGVVLFCCSCFLFFPHI